MSVYFADEHITLHHGPALDVVRTLPDQSVDCVVTSPPYFGLRDYGAPGQYGAEESPAEFVGNLVALYAEVRRALANDGTFWLNLGDSYSSRPWKTSRRRDRADVAAHADRGDRPHKSLLGIPWRVALALQDDGWILRNEVIWSKPNTMPESVKDRLATRHEHLFLFTKSPRYWFDLDSIREPHTMKAQRRPSGRKTDAIPRQGQPKQAWSTATREDLGVDGHPAGRNPGDVWTVPTQPFPGAHFATFPTEIPRRCIVAGCKPGGTVLDPCSGSGTTGAAAQANGRRYIGIDINADYLRLSLETRLQNGAFNLGGVA